MSAGALVTYGPPTEGLVLGGDGFGLRFDGGDLVADLDDFAGGSLFTTTPAPDIAQGALLVADKLIVQQTFHRWVLRMRIGRA